MYIYRYKPLTSNDPLRINHYLPENERANSDCSKISMTQEAATSTKRGPPSKVLSHIKAKGAALKSNEPTGSKTPTWLAVGTLQKAKKGSLAKVTRATEHGRSQIT